MAASKNVKRSASSKKPIATQAKVAKKAVKPRSRAKSTRSFANVISSKKTSGGNRAVSAKVFWERFKFVFVVGLVAAFLVSVSIGLMTYSTDERAENASQVGLVSLKTASNAPRNTGDVLEVELYADSGSDSVNVMQAGIRYPAEDLEFVAVENGETFMQEAATDSGTPGLVRVARSIKPGGTPVSGENKVVTLKFKVLAANTSPIPFMIEKNSTLLVSSTSNTDILSAHGDTKFEL